MQEIQPLLKELQAKYPGKDLDSRTKLSEEMRALYKEKGVKTSSAFLPLLIQMPVLMALFQALSRVEFLKSVTSSGWTLVRSTRLISCRFLPHSSHFQQLVD